MSLRGDVLASGFPRDAMRADDRAALATGAAPGVADPPEPFTTKLAVETAKAHRANRDVMRHRSKDAPRLVTAQDIARSRLAPRTDATVAGGMGRMLAWYTELHRAQDELNRGEWHLP